MRTNILFKSKGLVKVLPFYLFAFLLLTSCADLDYTEETTRDEEWTFTYFNEGIKGLVSGVYAQVYNNEFASNSVANKDVDGGLIGGASLKADDFIAIAEQF